MEQTISQLDDGILADFERCAHSCSEWDGDERHSFMYTVWLKCKERFVSDGDIDRTIYFYPNIKIEHLSSASDAELNNDDDIQDEEMWEMDGQRYHLSEVQVEIINEAEDTIENDVENIPVSIVTGSSEFIHSQSVASTSGAFKNEILAEKPLNIFQTLDENRVREIKIGQRKQRRKVERACIPSSSMNIHAKKKQIDLKAEKFAEREQKKLLREKKKAEKLTKKKSFEVFDDLIDFNGTPSDSPTFTDESTACSTPTSTPIKSKRAKINRRKPRNMVIESSDSE